MTMVERSKNIKGNENRFEIIDSKLKNSFDSVRKDNEKLKRQISELSKKNKELLEEKISFISSKLEEVKKERPKKESEKENELSVEILKINQRIDEIKKDFSDSNEVFLKDALSTKKEIAKIKKEVGKKIKDDPFEKNLVLLNDFEKLKEEFNEFKKSFEKEIEKKISKHLTEDLEKEVKLKIEEKFDLEEKFKKEVFSQIELIKEEKCDRDAVNKVISLIREDFSNKLSVFEKKLEETQKNNEEKKILKEESKIEETKKEETIKDTEEREIEEKKSIFSKIIDSFFDE